MVSPFRGVLTTDSLARVSVSGRYAQANKLSLTAPLGGLGRGEGIKYTARWGPCMAMGRRAACVTSHCVGGNTVDGTGWAF